MPRNIPICKTSTRVPGTLCELVWSLRWNDKKVGNATATSFDWTAVTLISIVHKETTRIRAPARACNSGKTLYFQSRTRFPSDSTQQQPYCSNRIIPGSNWWLNDHTSNQSTQPLFEHSCGTRNAAVALYRERKTMLEYILL